MYKLVRFGSYLKTGFYTLVRSGTPAILAASAVLLCGHPAWAQVAPAWAVNGDINVVGDFDGDGKLDAAYFRPNVAGLSYWFVHESSGLFIEQQWGLPGDIPVPGDYDGDGKTDFAVWRPSNGTWYILLSATNTIRIQQWGLTDDIPVVGDYDGDGKADMVVFRPSNGFWYCILSTKGLVIGQFGLYGDVPVAADYDGDGATDLAIWRPADGTWHVKLSSTSTEVITQWGLGTNTGFPADVPVIGDFDNDGKADLAVWRAADSNLYIVPSATPTAPFTMQVRQPSDVLSTPAVLPAASRKLTVGNLGTGVFIRVTGDFDGDGHADFALWQPTSGFWYIVESTNPTAPATPQWGLPGDVPVTGDYNGDGTTDIAVWRPSNGTWYVGSGAGTSSTTITQWGLPGDFPIVGDFDGDGKIDFVVWRPAGGAWHELFSHDGSNTAIPWGMRGDIPMAGDFDGNGVSDLVIWRPGDGGWRIMLNSIGTTTLFQQFGSPGDLPFSGDFDNDGKTDYVIYRPYFQRFFFNLSTQPGLDLEMPWGVAGNAAIYNQPPITSYIGTK